MKTDRDLLGRGRIKQFAYRLKNNLEFGATARAGGALIYPWWAYSAVNGSEVADSDTLQLHFIGSRILSEKIKLHFNDACAGAGVGISARITLRNFFRRDVRVV